MTTQAAPSHPAPDATLVMPVKNVAPWVGEALRSIDRQTGFTLEILCVEDGSTDGTPEAIRAVGDPRVRIIPNEGAGVSDGRNTGLAAARGRVLFYLDGDDRLLPGALDRLYRALAEHPAAGAVAGACRIIDEAGRPLADLEADRPAGFVTEAVREGLYFHTSQCAYRIEAVREVGWARRFFLMAQDRDFLLRFAERFEVVFVPGTVAELRARRSSVSRGRSRALARWYSEQVRAFAAERRRTGSDPLMRGEAPRPPADLPSQRPAPSEAFEARMIMTAAWAHRARGETDRALAAVGRLFRRPRRLAHARGLPRLLVVLARDSLSGRPDGGPGPDRESTNRSGRSA